MLYREILTFPTPHLVLIDIFRAEVIHLPIRELSHLLKQVTVVVIAKKFSIKRYST